MTTDAVELQHALIGASSTASSSSSLFPNPHPDAQWFANAGLGLFVHWGISSVHGSTDLSWGMISGTPWNAGSDVSRTISAREYWALADRFNPAAYDPERWLSAAKRAGVTYAVLTTKHHDGYTLWPSAIAELGVQTHLGGRDLVAPFVDACRKLGLRVGLYYSPPDWHMERNYMSFEYESFHRTEEWRRSGSGPRPDVSILGIDHTPSKPADYPPDFAVQIAGHVRRQLEELLTRYGKIDLLWFDGRPYPLGTTGEITIEDIRSFQPGIVVNPRLFGQGDYTTPEVRFPTSRPAGWWELCTFWNSPGWGYMTDERYRDTADILSEVVKVRAWGGNELISVGPRPDGSLPEAAYERMAELEAWMKHSGTAIVDTSPCPESIHASVPVTCQGNILYLHLQPDSAGIITVEGLDEVAEVKLLRTKIPLFHSFEDRSLVIAVPNAARTSLVDVVELRL